MTLIHPTAVIDPKAELDSSVKVGAYTVIGPNVQIGTNKVTADPTTFYFNQFSFRKWHKFLIQ